MISVKIDWKWIYWRSDYKWKDDIFPSLIDQGLNISDLKNSVYVIRLNTPFAIQYPLGISPLIYIGEGNFQSRISSHSKKWLCNLSEIIESSGLHIGVATPRSIENPNTYKDTEAALIHEFFNLYGTAPLNNKQYEYQKFDHDFDKKELRIALTIGQGMKYKWAIKPMKANIFYQHYHKTHD